MIENIDKLFSKDLSNLELVVNWATEQQKYGSFSARRPDLGRMFKCRHCGTRRRVNTPVCCNTKFATTQRAWDPVLGFHQVECPERAMDSAFSKPMLKRFKHKKHGQSRQFKVRQIIYLFQHNEFTLKLAALEMQVPLPDKSSIPSFAEKYFEWREGRETRKERRITNKSRKINRGQA